MNPISASIEAAAPFARAAALATLRLLPAALLSPLMGGPAVPAPVRLAVALGLGAAAATRGTVHPPADLLPAAGWELLMGLALGLLAALPLEAARAGGRLADTLRGATLAELHVAPLRQRETALGDLLAQWTMVLAGAAGADRLLAASLLGTFDVVPAGAGASPAALLAAGTAGATELLAAGLSLGAPAAAGVLAADLVLAAAARPAPALGIPAAAAPARAGLGLAATALAAAALGGRLVEEVFLAAGLVRGLGKVP